MGYIRTKGVVIREIESGEADKIVTILTQSRGKITAMAKNARRPKNRLAAGTQLLCYSDFILFKGKDMHSMSSCDVLEPFYEIRNDIVKLTYSAHVLDLLNDVTQENQPATKVLQLFLNTLHMLSKTARRPELIVRIFELRLLAILGYTPWVRSCLICGSDNFNDFSFSFKKCGFLCRECLAEDMYAVHLSPGTAKAMNHIVHAKLNDLFNFNLSEEALSDLGKIMNRYLRERLERSFTKLDFLKTLEIQ